MKNVMVTGAAAGIGKETAILFAKRGERVIVADINEGGAQLTVAEIEAQGGTAVSYLLDVSSENEWEQCAQWVKTQYGPLHVLVNNAGVMDLGGFVETDPAGWQRMVDINLMSVIYGSKVFAQQMISEQVRGHIVNLSSAGAFLPSELDAAYGVVKAAVLMATQALRTELSAHGIGVTAIAPGAIRTNLIRNGQRNGLSEDQLAQWNSAAGSVQTRLAFGGPDKVARRIVKSVDKNWAVVPVNPEAWLLYYAFRLAPGLVRWGTSIARFDRIDALLRHARPLLDRLTKNQETSNA
ncbi:putative oxidoreductase [Gordonia effusa NBRC 100432]|uniref:Putative oxidoreductase n=1 Tax=Gordonia effusa NBRC 100432 TaxID=1077974 RepID=H0R3W8_9ACTN|nr:SDR family NAD(P)-dependent oxidoreductase [Gordonia effusa]GAB19769.1 putative oxidoreductase [Gordonia effusa NBRC 100432]